MPLIIKGRLEVMSGPTLDYTLVPLRLTWTHFASLAGLIFGILLAAVIAQYNIVSEQFYETLRIYLVSGLFISSWGLMQFILHSAAIPYPYAVFNNSASSGVWGYYAQSLAQDNQRITSVAMEPSYLAIVLVGMIPMILIAVFYGKPILGRTYDRVALFVIGLALLLTVSSTGYVGVIILIILVPFCLSQYRQLRWKLFMGTFVLLAGLAGTYIASPIVRDTLNAALFDKAASGSALERTVIVINDLNYFRRYPILGIGWASAPTHDVIIGMLANCGVIGLASFSIAIVTISLRLRRTVSREPQVNQYTIPSLMMFLSLVITCLCYVVSGPIGRGEFWVILGLAISAIGLARRRQEVTVAA
jgi:O-antigen ligase